MSTKPTITAEAQSLTRDHPLAADENFLVVLSEALARLHPTAPQAERVAVLNATTAEHTQRVDAAELAAARADERARVAAILALDEAKGREASAQHLALNTDTTADAARGILSGLPRGAAWGATNQTSALPEGFLRSADAPAGLIGTDAEGNPVLLESGVSTEPSKPTATNAEKTKAMWGSVVAGINREGAKPAPAHVAK